MNRYRSEIAKQYETTGLTVSELYVLMWKRYFDFEGVSSKREFWLVNLVNIAIIFVYYILIFLINDLDMLTLVIFVFSIYSVAVQIPQLALMVRRLHDTGVSGWNYLWFLTGVGGIYVIYLLARDSR